MNYEEAVEAMKQGKKVRNENFTSDEFFEMKDGKIVCEMGYPMATWYRGLDWQKSGWSIVQDSPKASDLFF